MVFSSLLFLFRFLPVILLLYFIVPRGWRNAVLFFGSLIFYAWGEPVYVVLMLFSTAVDFTHGWYIRRSLDAGRRGRAKIALISSVVINLSLLGVFKYTDFIIGLVNGALGLSIPQPGLPLPIGISFYTFQTMSYSIDVYRGDADVQKNIIDFGAYVAMFPQLIAGPIVRYQTVAKELNDRQESPSLFADGIALFMAGLGKKVLLANNIGLMWDAVSALPAAQLSAAAAWLGALAYGFQIYFDFSGYSDMARGLGLMLGFHFPLNFDYPYISRSVTEFWRRWHISLGTWFREYVYIPLGGNRKGLAAQIRNILIVWMLTGIWHGASVNFFIWGLYFGVLLVMEKLFLLKWLKRCPRPVAWLYTTLAWLIGWAIFASVDNAAGLPYFAAMLGAGGAVDSTALYLLRNYGVMLIICIAGSTPIVKRLFVRVRRAVGGADGQGMLWQLMFSAASIVLFVICTAYLVDATYNPFLYFRF